jgi:DNA-binding response OmpR family regulator
MHVIVCSTDTKFADLLLQNLNKCGFVYVRHVQWAACCALPPIQVQSDPDIIVADLCCPAPECWRGIERVRGRFPGKPVLFLGHGWPGSALTYACWPGRIVRKPLAMNELLTTFREITSSPVLKPEKP